MTEINSDYVLLAFLLFCRIGSCLMLMPGFSSPRVPVQMRLFIAIAVTLALGPLLVPELREVLFEPAASNMVLLLFTETLTGVFVGLLGRLFFLALQFMAAALAHLIGFAGLPEIPVEGTEPVGAFADLITLTATVLFFVAELHWEVLRGLVHSYSVLPVDGPIAMEFGLQRLVEAASESFLLTLQISSPFIVYAFAINLSFGLLNKLTPQIPVYFVSLPFVIAGGLLLFYLIAGEFLTLFVDSVTSWLQRA